MTSGCWIKPRLISTFAYMRQQRNALSAGPGNEKNWSNPDAAADPSAYVQYLDNVFAGMGVSSGQSVAQQNLSLGSSAADNYKLETYRLLGLQPGNSVLDVGCGTGADVIALAEILQKVGGGAGRAIGVDVSETMVTAARHRWAQLRTSESFTAREKENSVTVEFHKGDVQHLSRFDAASFDACRSDRALQHVPNPTAAVQEMVRVVKPGSGRCVCMPVGGCSLGASSTHCISLISGFAESLRQSQIGRLL